MSAFDEYLATVPEPQRAELERIRQVVRDELAGFDLSKGTIRFTPEKPIPGSALRRLLRERLREIESG
jgi:hypothetical protein